MAIKRIVSNIATPRVDDVHAFYRGLFDLDVAMDMGWITTLTSGAQAQVQISIASEGGSGTDVPDLSIEVDNLDEIYARAKALGLNIPYELTTEPWGLRRFYVLDPTGKLLNILEHGN